MSLSVHEAAHAWTADRLGDPTARMLGRITLNPLAHIDWIGTVLFPLIAIMTAWPTTKCRTSPSKRDNGKCRYSSRGQRYSLASFACNHLELAVLELAASCVLRRATWTVQIPVPLGRRC